MKIETTASDLKAVIARAAKITPKRPSVPVLATSKLAVKGDIELQATDLDNHAFFKVKGKVLEEGEALVTTHALLGILNRVPSGSLVVLEQAKEGAWLTATFSGADVDLVWEDKEMGAHIADFPVQREMPEVSGFHIDASVLRDAFERVLFAVSAEETRHYLNGVFLHHEDGGLAAVAMDGHRLAKCVVPCEWKPVDLTPEVIVPTSAIKTILENTPKDSDQMVSFQYGGSEKSHPHQLNVVLWQDDFSLRSRLIRATYPDYTQIIKDPADMIALPLDRERLAKALKYLVGTSKKLSVVFDLCSNGRLSLACDVLRTELPTDYRGEPMLFKANGRYCMDILHRFTGDTVTFHLDGPGEVGGPILITAPQSDPGYTCVQMPMRIFDKED